jgi:hypothetical protein
MTRSRHSQGSVIARGARRPWPGVQGRDRRFRLRAPSTLASHDLPDVLVPYEQAPKSR